MSLERTARNEYAIKAFSYVGSAQIEGRQIVIEEKIHGALAALLQTDTPLDARVIEVAGFVERSARVLEQLAHRFMLEVRSYLLSGRRKTYTAMRKVGGFPKGKLNIAGTMRLWAQGRIDQMTFTSDDLSADLPENRLIGLALANLDRALTSGASDLRSQVRTAAVLFEDVAWPHLARQPLERLSELFNSALLNPHLSGMRKLLGLARAFALHFGPGGVPGEPIPVSWFVNLETLFEDAVIAVLRKEASFVLLPSFRFSEGRGFGKTILTLPPSYNAKPDVVGCLGDEFLVIMDAKYKDPEGDPDQDDIYQLLAHMGAFGARVGVLIYPSDHFELRALGAAAGGGRIYQSFCAVPRIAEDIRILLQELNSRENLTPLV